jgi:UDP-glucose 4-epimerase
VVLSDILAQLEGAGPLTVRDDRPVRDFIHIDDVTAGILAALRHEAGGIFNLGSGKGVSIGDLARLVLAAAGQPARPVVSQHVSARSSHLVLDTAEAATQLGWYPQIPLAEGLHMILPTTP